MWRSGPSDNRLMYIHTRDHSLLEKVPPPPLFFSIDNYKKKKLIHIYVKGHLNFHLRLPYAPLGVAATSSSMRMQCQHTSTYPQGC